MAERALTIYQSLSWRNFAPSGGGEEAADRLSFREFLALRASDSVPDDTTRVKFRNRLRGHNLVDELHEAITAQLARRGVQIREGSITLVDATLIRASMNPPRKPRGQIQTRISARIKFVSLKAKIQRSQYVWYGHWTN